MEEWKSYKLGDIASVQTGPFGSQLHNEDYVSAGTPIVTVEHLGARKFSKQNLPLVSEVDKERLSKYTLHKGDIVFSRVGSVDRCSYVSQDEDGWLFSGRCLRVRSGSLVYPLFLYCHSHRELKQGTPRPLTTKKSSYCHSHRELKQTCGRKNAYSNSIAIPIGN